MSDISNHYIEKGSGRPLILLHGNGEDLSYFVNQIDVFSEYFRVIAIDTRGHGLSPRGDAPFSLCTFADDLYDFMTDHRIPSADILGFSDGGNTALIFALKHPEMVSLLVLNGANIFPEGICESDFLQIKKEYDRALTLSKTDKSYLKIAELMSLMVNEPHIEPHELHRVRSRTLVIAGDNDVIKKEHTELIAANIPDSTLVFINGDHLIAFNNPSSFNDAVLSFLLQENK